MNLFFCSILTFLFYLHLFTHSLPKATEPALIEDGNIALKKEKAAALAEERLLDLLLPASAEAMPMLSTVFWASAG